MDANPSLGQFLVMGTLEVMLNQAVALHPEGPATLERLAGRVVRVRAYNPDFIFYCLIERDGIELATTYDGDAHVRIRGSAGSLLYRVLATPDQQPDGESDIRISGDDQAAADLAAALDTFNLMQALRTWLQEHVALPEVMGLLRRADPAWLERLQDLPQLVGQTLEELRRQAAVQQQILAEVRSLKSSLRAERRTDIICITVGTALLALAFMTATGAVPVFSVHSDAAREQTWLLAALGLALMLSRLFGKRYENS